MSPMRPSSASNSDSRSARRSNTLQTLTAGPSGQEQPLTRANGTKASAPVKPLWLPRRCVSQIEQFDRFRKGHPAPMTTARLLRRMATVGVAAAMLASAACSSGGHAQRGLVIGKSPSTTAALPGPTIVEDPSTSTTAQASTTTGAPRTGGGTGPAVAPKTTGLPDGSPYGGAIPFTSSTAVPTNLVWVLAIGSDARPGQDLRRSNGDSIHLVGVDPQTG